MLKLYPHLISHFHTFHFQQAAKLSKMSVRRDEISSMKRKNTINGQRVGCFGVDKPLVCLYLHLYLQLQFHIPLPFCHCIQRFLSSALDSVGDSLSSGPEVVSFFLLYSSALSPANWKFPIALNLKVMPISQMALGKILGKISTYFPLEFRY